MMKFSNALKHLDETFADDIPDFHLRLFKGSTRFHLKDCFLAERSAERVPVLLKELAEDQEALCPVCSDAEKFLSTFRTIADQYLCSLILLLEDRKDDTPKKKLVGIFQAAEAFHSYSTNPGPDFAIYRKFLKRFLRELSGKIDDLRQEHPHWAVLKEEISKQLNALKFEIAGDPDEIVLVTVPHPARQIHDPLLGDFLDSIFALYADPVSEGETVFSAPRLAGLWVQQCEPITELVVPTAEDTPEVIETARQLWREGRTGAYPCFSKALSAARVL